MRYVRRFGFRTESLRRDLSLALGSGELTPLELARGYAVFANGGYRITPWLIDHVLDSQGKVVMLTRPQTVCAACADAEEERARQADEAEKARAEAGETEPEPSSEEQGARQARAEADRALREAAEARLAALEPQEREQVLQGPRQPKYAPRVLSPQVAFIMNTMLRDVIRFGTGRRALVLQRKDLAGKTGTTNDQRDAWFAGFNPALVTVAWVGFDDPRPLGSHETGAHAALPMWIGYMGAALRDTPEIPLKQPPGIVSVRIDARTGELASADSADTMFEYFRVDHVPTRRDDAADVPSPAGGGNGESAPGGDITEDLF